MVLDSVEEGSGLHPIIILGHGASPPRGASPDESRIGLGPPCRGNVLHHDGAGTPVLLRLASARSRDRPPRATARRDLLRLRKIGVCGITQRGACQRHITLIPLHVRPLIDGHGEMAGTEQSSFIASRHAVQRVRVEMRIRREPVRGRDSRRRAYRSDRRFWSGE